MEPLADPLEDRKVNNILSPPSYPLSKELLYPKNVKIPDWENVRDHLTREGKLEKSDLLDIINSFIKIISNEPNIVKIDDPVTVVGDIHGQYYDLLQLFKTGGSPENTQYLFLGDYVDRGGFSTEVIILLMTIKINFPKTLIMIRGNHECRQLTSHFNFKKECEIKYDSEVYDRIMDGFDALPISCVINEKFVGIHGGISPNIDKMEDLNNIDRFIEPPKDGAFCDILWADPCEKDEDALETEYMENEARGCSYVFGSKAATEFLNKNEYLSIIRAHEAQLQGFKMHQWDDTVDFPSVITIFSAPNYCDLYNNKGAIIKFDNNSVNITQFNYSPHPFMLPDMANLFNWSLPFVSEKISSMLLHIIKKDDMDFENTMKKKDVKITDKEQNTLSRLKMKIKIITTMMKMQKTLREENELIIKLKGFCPGNKIPRGLIIQGPMALKSALDRFENAKTLDKENEQIPKGYEKLFKSFKDK